MVFLIGAYGPGVVPVQVQTVINRNGIYAVLPHVGRYVAQRVWSRQVDARAVPDKSIRNINGPGSAGGQNVAPVAYHDLAVVDVRNQEQEGNRCACAFRRQVAAAVIGITRISVSAVECI